MKISLTELVRENGALDLSTLKYGRPTKYICINGHVGDKTNICDRIAEYFSEIGRNVVTAEAPCDKYFVNLLNNAISQNKYEDRYTEELLLSFSDGLLSNYMIQLRGYCDFFICQGGPINQYADCIAGSSKTYSEIYKIQQPERLAKFNMYIHLDSDTRRLYDTINSTQKELEFIRESYNVYIDTANMTVEDILNEAIYKIFVYLRYID